MQIRDRVKKLRRVRARDLRPNPKNWRKHPEQQANALRGVLAEIGYADALLARELKDGSLQLIDGHLRAETTPDQIVPVLVLDLTEAEADKLLAVLDPLASMAKTDAGKLDELMGELTIDSADLRKLLTELADKARLDEALAEITETEVPEPPDVPITKPGDLWHLGAHRLLCGDSSDPQQLDRLLAGAAIHLVNTDPPYNVKVEPRSNNAIAAGLSSFAGPTNHQGLDAARHPGKLKATHKKLRAKDRPLANDFVSDAEFDRLLKTWFGNISRVLLPGRAFYIWGGYANVANYPSVLKACELYFSQAVIWVKQHPVLTRKDFMGNHEWCFYGWREGSAHVYLGPNNATDVWSVKKVSPQSMVHLTEKPVELAARAMQYSTRPGEHVLDLFGGSGSTLIAAEQAGRRAYLMELDAPYCDVIVTRWEKLTGRKATRPNARKQASLPRGKAKPGKLEKPARKSPAKRRAVA